MSVVNARAGNIGAVEELLVHHLQREGLLEVGAVPVPGGTDEHGLLEGAGYLRKTAVVLDVGREVVLVVALYLVEGEVTANLPVSTDVAADIAVFAVGVAVVAAVVHIHEEVGGAQAVGLEHLHSGGEVAAVALIVGIEVATEVVVQLNVHLCAGRHADGCSSEKK